VRWELPAGFEAGEVRWPYPIRFRTGHLVSYGYEHEVLLPVEIRVPAATSGREARLAARVDWLECEEACLPGRAEVSLTLPVRGAAALGEHARLFAAARRRLPARDAGWRFAASPAGGAFRLAVHAPRGTALRDAYFFPLTPRLVDYSKPQPLRNEGAAYRLEIARDPNGAPAARLAGVLVAETASGTSALEVDVPLAAGVRKTSIDQEGKP
jgi:thiol:disulfide interchange protein DsbD